jgi:hypothetical protein
MPYPLRMAGSLQSTMARYFFWLQGKRTVAFALALLLVAVPTFAALFPGLIFRTDRGWRIAIMVGWLTVAATATIASQSRESDSDARVAAMHQTARASHRNTIRSYLTLMLSPETSGIPATYNSCVYLPDGGLLLPWFPDFVSDTSDIRVFGIGKGATGIAYSEERPVAVVGDAVSSGEHGLTQEQQEHFAGSKVVVAVPVRYLQGEIVGILSVISDWNDGTFISDEAEVQVDGINLLTEAADEIGVTLEGME